MAKETSVEKEIPYSQYLKKSFFWVAGNALFGLTPLLFMQFVYLVSGFKVGGEEIKHLVHDGVVLFVCCAIMGAVLVEFVLSGYEMKISRSYKLLIIPGFIMLLLLTDYFLINLKAIDTSCFALDSWTSLIVIVLSFLFCTFNKANYYIKEDTRHE